MDRSIVLLGTVAALVGAGFQGDWLIVGAIAAIGLGVGVASLPWKSRWAGSTDEVSYLCSWVVFWPFGLGYLLWRAFMLYLDGWSDYLARRKYERAQGKR